MEGGDLERAAEWLDRITTVPDEGRDLLWRIRGGRAVQLARAAEYTSAEAQLKRLQLATRWNRPLVEHRLRALRASAVSRVAIQDAIAQFGKPCPACDGRDLYRIATCTHQAGPLPPARKLSPGAFQPSLATVYAAAAYRSGWDLAKSDPASVLLRRLKLDADRIVLDAFGCLLADYAAFHTPLPQLVDAVTFVPTAYEREQARGVGIPQRLSEVVAVVLGLPWCELLLQTGTHAGHTERDPHVRRRSLEAAWRVSLPNWVRDARILLIDDVVTTGLTASMAAELLLRGGARGVCLLTLFHTERSS